MAGASGSTARRFKTSYSIPSCSSASAASPFLPKKNVLVRFLNGFVFFSIGATTSGIFRARDIEGRNEESYQYKKIKMELTECCSECRRRILLLRVPFLENNLYSLYWSDIERIMKYNLKVYKV